METQPAVAQTITSIKAIRALRNLDFNRPKWAERFIDPKGSARQEMAIRAVMESGEVNEEIIKKYKQGK